MQDPWEMDDAASKEEFHRQFLMRLRAMREQVKSYCDYNDKKLRLIARVAYKILGIFIRRFERYDNVS